MSQEDYYKLLKISKTATVDEIKKAYRKKALKYHPDKNQGDKHAEEMFKKVSEAYEVLSDENKRRMYDQYGAEGVKQQFGAGGFQWNNFSHADEFGDIFESFFGGGRGGGGGGGSIFETLFGGGGGGTRRTSTGGQIGSNLRVEVQIDFMESVSGTEKQIEITKPEVCKKCHGTGAQEGCKPTTCRHCGGHGQVHVARGFFSVAQACPICKGTGVVIEKPCGDCHGTGRIRQKKKLKIKIPAGVDNGSRLKISGEGEAGTLGAPAGDLYVIIHVSEHEIFHREGNNVICEVPISFPQAALGCQIEVPTVHGPVVLKIPSGTQSGKLFRMKKKGICDLHGYTGDQFVRVNVETPTSLTREQKEMLEKFDESCSKTSHPNMHNFLGKLKNLFK